MALNYEQLKTQIQAYVEDDGTEFLASIDTIIANAEKRIYREADLNVFRKTATSTWPINSRFVTKPTDFVVDRFMYATIGGNALFLKSKDVSFIQTFWPNISSTAAPRFYAEWDDNTFIVAPTLDGSYSFTLGYTYRPTSIVSASTTWLGNNAEDVLLYASIMESYEFLKHWDAAKIYEAKYMQAINLLRNEEETRQRREEQRWGERR